MASEIHAFQFSIPAGTAIATPAEMDLTMPVRQVTGVEIKVPPGPRGLVGFALGAAGNAIIPAIPGSWVIADDYDQLWNLENYIESGAWQAFGYNLGRYSHTVYFTFYCTVLGIAPAASTTLIDLSTLSSSN